MNQSLSLFLLFAITVFISACQSDSKTSSTPAKEKPSMKAPESYQAQYYVRYIADEQELKAEASFLSGSKQGEKTAKTFSSVLLNNNSMRLDQSNNKKTYYKLEQKGEAKQTMAFQLISEKGKKEEDVVVIPEVEDFSFGKKISIAKGATLIWEGEPLGNKESLVLLFTNEKERTTSTIINGPTEKTELKIPSSKIQKLETGTNRVYIVRKNRFIKERKDTEGALRTIRALTEYYSKTIEVEIVE